MMMENNTEMDPFKENIRKKVKETPTNSSNDERLWEDVLWELNAQNKLYRLHQGWYAMAASVLLFISVGAGILVYNYSEKENIGRQLSYKSNSEIPTLASSDVEKETQKNDQVMFEKAEKQVEQSPVAINKEKVAVSPAQLVKIIQSGEKTSSHSLVDGSLISLHEGAEIKVAESFSENRKIILSGEAYFDVAKDPSHPFEVFFDNYSLKVLGTKFNIRNIKGEEVKEVTVTEGIVKVFYNTSKEGVELVKGQQLRLEEGKAPVVTTVDPTNYISWKTGQLEFKKASLEEVMILLARIHKVEINLTPEIKNCKFTGDLSGLSLNEGLDIVKMSTSVNVEKSGSKIFVSGKGCE